MKKLLAGVAVAALLGTSAFAQSPNTQSPAGSHKNSSTNADSNSSSEGNAHAAANLPAAQKIQQELQSAGFTEVKVVAESFVVQAKSKDGDPVLMTIGPHGMSVFESMNTDKSAGPAAVSTTGSSANTQSANTGMKK